MKRHETFSLYAFIIALLVHLLIALLLIIAAMFQPPKPPMQKRPPQEERFRLSLKERPEIQKESLVKNDLPEKPLKRSVPHGEQMITPSAPPPSPRMQNVPKPSPKPAPQSVSQPQPQPTPPVKPETQTQPAEPKKAFERHVAKTVADIERQPLPQSKQQGLYDILSKADPNAQQQLSKSTTKISDSIQRLYGDKFNELSEGEQKYIIDNQEIMRRITQSVLDRYGRSRIPDNIRINDTNMIEFYLYPDGSISDVRFLKNSQLSVLDDTTKEVIELAYGKYPRPQQKTLIRYRVYYDLR